MIHDAEVVGAAGGDAVPDPIARLEALLPPSPHVTGGEVRPGGDDRGHGAGPVVEANEAAGPDTQALVAIPIDEPDEVMGAVEAVRAEMAERDRELRDVLARLGDLYQGIAGAVARGTPAGAAPRELEDPTMRTLLRSIDSLATVTEASIDRMSDVTRSVQKLAEAVGGVATRVDRLVQRTDESEARLERVAHLSEGLSEQVGMIGRHLGQAGARPRPPLRAVVTDEGS